MKKLSDVSGRKNTGAAERGPDQTANGPCSATARKSVKSSETKKAPMVAA